MNEHPGDAPSQRPALNHDQPPQAPNREGATDQGVDVSPLLRDTAIGLVTERGLTGLDFDLIDTRARLPSGSCHDCYGNQGNLVAAMLESIAARFHARLHEVFGRHPDDPVAAVVEWFYLLVGPNRDEAKVAWTLLLDPGVRSQVTMYADALQAGWERQVAAGLGSSVDRVRAAWSMIEGWACITLIRDRAMPAPEVVAAYVRTLFEESGIDRRTASA